MWTNPTFNKLPLMHIFFPTQREALSPVSRSSPALHRRPWARTTSIWRIRRAELRIVAAQDSAVKAIRLILVQGAGWARRAACLVSQ